MRELDFEIDGAALHRGVAFLIFGEIEAALTGAPRGRAGVRLHELQSIAQYLQPDGALSCLAATHLGASVQPVRAILFDKSRGSNWSLGWHQDRTIAVCERHDVVGFGPWSVKDGVVHVEPPFVLIASMVTLRVHLDDVPTDNAPLLIARGSHRLGRVSAHNAERTAASSDVYRCVAERGDVWAYATSILHASEPSQSGRGRRVLQIDFCADALPTPLEWAVDVTGPKKSKPRRTNAAGLPKRFVRPKTFDPL